SPRWRPLGVPNPSRLRTCSAFTWPATGASTAALSRRKAGVASHAGSGQHPTAPVRPSSWLLRAGLAIRRRGRTPPVLDQLLHLLAEARLFDILDAVRGDQEEAVVGSADKGLFPQEP